MTVSEAMRGNLNLEHLSAKEFKSLVTSYNARERRESNESSQPASGEIYIWKGTEVIFSPISTRRV